MFADLHCHTVKSDGSTSVKDLVNIASLLGLPAIAITDHDTFDGVEEAEFFGKKFNVKIIPGAEISAFDFKRNRKVHILCYFPDDISRLETIFEETKKERRRASEEIIDIITSIYPISKDMIYDRAKKSTNIFKQHIIQTLADAGFTVSIYGDLFDKLFRSERKLQYKDAKYPDVRDVINNIRVCGGIAVLAHPPVYNSYELLDELASHSLIDGVEVFHSRNKIEDEKILISKAKQYGIIMTGGTDFHGMYGSRAYPLGLCTTNKENFNKLIKLKGR